MTVYVSIPQIPITLKFEEPIDDVGEHFRQLLEAGSIHRYEFDEGQEVVVNYGVIASLTLSEGRRALEVAELHRGLRASIAREEVEIREDEGNVSP